MSDTAHARSTATGATNTVVVEHLSRVTAGVALAVFGVGFGMVGRVLVIAVQNTVPGRSPTVPRSWPPVR